MADIYCDSAGSNTSPYDTWAKAATTYTTALAAWATGDRILVKADNTVEASTGSTTFLGGATATHVPVYAANASDVYTKGNMTNPTFSFTGASSKITLDGYQLFYGMAFRTDNDIQCGSADSYIELNDCLIQFNTSGSIFDIGSSGGDSVSKIFNCTITSISGNLLYRFGGGDHEINGGSFTGTASSNGLITAQSAYGQSKITFRGFDFSGGSFSGPLVDTSAEPTEAYFYRFVNCEFPASLSITDGVISAPGQFVEVINSDDAGKQYRYELHTMFGTLKNEQTVYRTAGYTDDDGDTHISHAFTSNSSFTDAAKIYGPLHILDNATTGSSQTLTVHTADDYTTAPNSNQLYMEVYVMSTSGETLATLGTSRPTDLLATTALTTTSGLWTGSPGHTHKLSYTFTAQEAGYIAYRVVLGEQDLSGETANSCYYCPLGELS